MNLVEFQSHKSRTFKNIFFFIKPNTTNKNSINRNFLLLNLFKLSLLLNCQFFHKCLVILTIIHAKAFYLLNRSNYEFMRFSWRCCSTRYHLNPIWTSFHDNELKTIRISTTLQYFCYLSFPKVSSMTTFNLNTDLDHSMLNCWP